MNVRILSVVLALSCLAAACTERTRSSDFVVLAQRAYPEGVAGNHDAMDDLWISLFRLPQWHFLATPERNQPTVQQIGAESWLLVFTDTDKLKRYHAASKGPAGDGGGPLLGIGAGDGGSSAPVVSMTPDAALAFLAAHANAATAGVRFNEGAGSGWFAPLKSVGDIHAMLKHSGKLDPPIK